VDLQISRNMAANVASGDYSVLGGGSANKADGDYSGVASGTSNQSLAERSCVGGGSANVIWPLAGFSVIAGGEQNAINDISGTGGYNSTIGGGYQNSTNGYFATISGGRNNSADGASSWVPGGRYATTRGIYGAGTWAAGRFAATGDAQRGEYLLRRQTTDATTTELSCDGGTPAAATRIVLPNNHAYHVRGRVVARNISTGDMATWEIKAAVRRGANAAATALVGSPTVTMLFNDSAASGWAVALSADTTNGSLKIDVAGAAATTVRWLAEIETLEVN
jgi:hypothetical protein